jgi:predicted ATPase
LTVLLAGESGVGKSALVRRFLHRLAKRHPDAVVFSGRCFPQESVPYKALDSLVDALSRHLLTLPSDQRLALLAKGGESLACLFPVFARLPGLAAESRRRREESDPQALRAEGISALRTLLRRLARRHPLVLFIDDLQWGDTDSYLLLKSLLRRPQPPSLLFLACYRGELGGSGTFLGALEQDEHYQPLGRQVHYLWVPPLGGEDSRRLALTLSAASQHPDPPWLKEVLAHAAGNPFLIHESVRSMVAAGEKYVGVDAGRAILGRVAGLSPVARRLLQLVAVAGRPLALAVARLALGLGKGLEKGSEGDFLDSVALLRGAHLLTPGAVDREEELELSHDRLRVLLLASLSAEDLRQNNEHLALAMESSGQAEAETLSVHFKAIAEVERAAHYAAEAARRAERA